MGWEYILISLAVNELVEYFLGKSKVVKANSKFEVVENITKAIAKKVL